MAFGGFDHYLRTRRGGPRRRVQLVERFTTTGWQRLIYLFDRFWYFNNPLRLATIRGNEGMTRSIDCKKTNSNISNTHALPSSNNSDVLCIFLELFRASPWLVQLLASLRFRALGVTQKDSPLSTKNDLMDPATYLSPETVVTCPICELGGIQGAKPPETSIVSRQEVNAP